jgi:hypothetical protein
MANLFSWLLGDEEEEELEAPIPIPIPAKGPFRPPFQVPESPAYDKFIEGPSLRTGTEDVLVADAPTPSLETYADQPMVLTVGQPRVPMFRQVADYTALFADQLPDLDAEKSRKITELQMFGEQESYLGREEDPGMMLRQGAAGLDPTKYDAETGEFDKMPRTAARRTEPLMKDLEKAAKGLDPTTEEGLEAIFQRLEEMGKLEYYKPSNLDPMGGAYGVMQLEAKPLEEALDYMRKNPNDSAVLRAFFMDRGLDMEDLQTDEGRLELVNEIAYNLETQDDPAFQGAVNAMYMLYRRNKYPQKDLDITDNEALIKYVVDLQSPKDKVRYAEKLKEYLTR